MPHRHRVAARFTEEHLVLPRLRRVLLVQTCRDGSEFCFHNRRCCSTLQAAPHLHAGFVVTTHEVGTSVNVDPHVRRTGSKAAKLIGSDTDDGNWLVIQMNCFPDNRRISREVALPKRVTQHGDGGCILIGMQ